MVLNNGIKLWNELQVDVRIAQFLSSFKRKLKFKFLSYLQAYYDSDLIVLYVFLIISMSLLQQINFSSLRFNSSSFTFFLSFSFSSLLFLFPFLLFSFFSSFLLLFFSFLFFKFCLISLVPFLIFCFFSCFILSFFFLLLA